MGMFPENFNCVGRLTLSLDITIPWDWAQDYIEKRQTEETSFIFLLNDPGTLGPALSHGYLTMINYAL